MSRSLAGKLANLQPALTDVNQETSAWEENLHSDFTSWPGKTPNQELPSEKTSKAKRWKEVNPRKPTTSAGAGKEETSWGAINTDGGCLAQGRALWGDRGREQATAGSGGLHGYHFPFPCPATATSARILTQPCMCMMLNEAFQKEKVKKGKGSKIVQLNRDFKNAWSFCQFSD